MDEAPGEMMIMNMMRKMIGWDFVVGDTWESARRKMKNWLQQYSVQLGIKAWSEQVNDRKRRVVVNSCEQHHWMYHSMRWHPPCCNDLNLVHCSRMHGHQHTKWNDGIVVVPAVPIQTLNVLPRMVFANSPYCRLGTETFFQPSTEN